MDDQDDLFGADEARQRLASEERHAKRMTVEDDKAKARRLAKEGMDRVEASTEDALPGWADAADAKLNEFAKLRTSFTVENLKQWAYEQGLPKPPNESAWGPVMLRARRAKWIGFLGFAATTQPSRHGLPNRHWQSMLFGEGL